MSEAAIIRAYRRIVKNAEKWKGCHLSAEEVQELAVDPAIYGAVDAFDEERTTEKGQDDDKAS